ncbi:MAG: hypothetical protein M1372_01765 [Patescibacteria group bacterium]|nr:hypothetical protein [Patescibacteria group bacterium]
MSSNNIAQTLTTTLNDALLSVANFIPRLISGLIVLLIGVIIASFLKQIILEIFKFLKIENWLKRYGVPESKDGGVNWSNILAEIVRWFIIILFLIPVADIWGLGKFTDVLNNLLLYLPNVFVAVLILLVGFVVARLVYDILLASIRGISKDVARSVATIGKWSVMIFVFLIVLSQLGIASDLIRILFSGFVAMIAIAGGLAFGLGGRDLAKETLEKLKKQL